jgi:hypothetical protein
MEVVDPNVLGIVHKINIGACFGVFKVGYEETMSNTGLDVFNLIIVDTALL